ncbi:MAG: hypothetical protein JWQ21_841 [Herminiimonas sp.]|nr:hypothetical protein [Herminiimonas sp.]
MQGGKLRTDNFAAEAVRGTAVAGFYKKAQ